MPIDYGDRVDGPTGVGAAASLRPPSDADGRLHPRNPFVGLLLALLLLLVGVVGLLAFILEPGIVFESSNRRSGLFLVGPLIALASGTITLVRGFLAIGPWVTHRATPLALRRQERAADLNRQSPWPLVVVGSLALAGFLVLIIVFGLYRPSQVNVVGRLLQVEIVGFLALLWISCLGLLAQKLYFRRFYVGRDPRNELPR